MAEKRKKEDETSEEKGFTITDRRRSGKDKPGEAPKEAPKEARRAAPKAAPPSKAEAPPEEAPSMEELPPADFQYLVLFLATQALLCLGEQPDPTTGEMTKNFAGAKHAIDLLGVILEKTKGNLTEEESHLVESLLYDTRMRYVQVTKGSP